MSNKIKRNIKYSILELATVSQGVSVEKTFKNIVSLAQKAEAYGYHRYWFAEHHNSSIIASSSPPVLVGHIAQQTQTIRVGAGGVMLPNHSPLVVAEQFGTLARLFPNRIDLGLGRAAGTDPDTARAIRTDIFEAAHQFPNEMKKFSSIFRKKIKVPKCVYQ